MKSKSLSVVLVAVIALVAVLGAACPTLLTGTQTASAAVGNYYQTISATHGSALSAQLHDLIVSTRTKYSTYADCRDEARTTDPGKASNAVMEFYTQEDIVTYIGSNGGNGTWNREHVWAQADSKTTNGTQLWGIEGAGGDLHHIRPAEKKLNADRGNQKYGEVSQKTPLYAIDLPNKGDVLGGYTNGNTFEPLDKVKGDVARIIMYVYIHYSTLAGGSVKSETYGELPITNIISASNADAAWKLLLKWNKLDPVDDIERNRNEEVYKIQGNRNPFIDNPVYADAIWGNVVLEEIPVESVTISPNSLTLDVGDMDILSAVVSPSNAPDSVIWSSSNSSVAEVENGIVTAVGEGTAIITATSTQNNSKKATATVTVNAPKQVVSISIAGTAKTTVYASGQTFNPEGLTVTALYDNGTSGVIPNDECSWVDLSGSQTLTKNSAKIKCVYEGVSCGETHYITVTVKAVTGITVSGTPTKTTYLVGNTINTTGLVVTLKLQDGGSMEIPAKDVSWTDDNDSEVISIGATSIRCSYVADGATLVSNNIGGITVASGAAVDEFVFYVNAAENGSTAEETLQAIKSALSAYSKLTQAEKDGVQSVYEKLVNAAESYNEQVDKTNENFADNAKNALAAVAQGFVTLSALLLSALYVVGKKG